MFLEDGTRAHFMKFLEHEFPSWVPRYERLYTKKYAPRRLPEEVSAMVRTLQERYGLSRAGATCTKKRIQDRFRSPSRGSCSARLQPPSYSSNAGNTPAIRGE